MSFRPPVLPTALLLGVAWLLLSAAGMRAVELPAAPASQILDQAQVLLPERAAALSERLRATAAGRSIWVYVVTVPTLDEMPSRQQERLQALGRSYADAWLKERVGVVILLNDESANAIFVASAAADRELPAWRRNLLVKDALRPGPAPTLVREKVERAALAVLEVLSHAQDEAQAAARRDRRVAFAMLIIALAGGGAVLFARRRGG